MAADFQNQFPNACHFASDGHFGSKFVTVVVTGDFFLFLVLGYFFGFCLICNMSD